MAWNNEKAVVWNRATPKDGLLFDEEFTRIYESLAALKGGIPADVPTKTIEENAQAIAGHDADIGNILSDISQNESDIATNASAITNNGNAISAHENDVITAVNEVHGIRQGAGNGFDADKLDGAEKSTDGTLSANSDDNIPSERAVKTYVDTIAVTNIREVGDIVAKFRALTNPAAMRMLPLDGNTIGMASSGAHYASDDYEYLIAFINKGDAFDRTSGWNNPVTLPNASDKYLAENGSANGGTYGAEVGNNNIQAKMPGHAHPLSHAGGAAVRLITGNPSIIQWYGGGPSGGNDKIYSNLTASSWGSGWGGISETARLCGNTDQKPEELLAEANASQSNPTTRGAGNRPSTIVIKWYIKY